MKRLLAFLVFFLISGIVAYSQTCTIGPAGSYVWNSATPLACTGVGETGNAANPAVTTLIIPDGVTVTFDTNDDTWGSIGTSRFIELKGDLIIDDNNIIIIAGIEVRPGGVLTINDGAKLQVGSPTDAFCSSYVNVWPCPEYKELVPYTCLSPGGIVDFGGNTANDKLRICNLTMGEPTNAGGCTSCYIFVNNRGNYNASGNVYPSTGGSGGGGAIVAGDYWTISVAGTLSGIPVVPGNFIVALKDGALNVYSNWAIRTSNAVGNADNYNCDIWIGKNQEPYCAPPGGFGGPLAFSKNGILPVKLLFFKGSKGLDDVKLSWATASELNFDYFDIEKSTDGIAFHSIAKVNGHGTTNERQDYTINDEKPYIGKNYYRLKSVDFDGYTEYFNVLMVDFDGKKNFSVYPNPSDGVSFTTETNFVPSNRAFIAIYSTIGSEIARYEILGNVSTITLPVKLESGVYFAKYISGDFTSTAQVLVR
jgi:hypothetical protein